MSYISKILIENFQIHSKTILNLDKGLNIFWGESDNGKSSIIRSLKWLICNKPLGEVFRQHKSKKTSVSVKKKGQLIRRRKSNKINEYKIDNESPHKALRSSVPEDITSALNLSEINIQSQNEVHFLVHESPGKRSRILNEVAGFEVMDKAISQANSEMREVNGKIKWKKEAIKDTQNQLDSLSWLTRANIELNQIEKFEEELTSTSEKCNQLQSILNQIERLQTEKRKLFPDSFSDELGKLISYKQKTEELELKKSNLISFLSKLHSTLESKDAIQEIDITELEKLYISIEKLQNKIFTIDSITQEIIDYELEHVSLYEKSLDTDQEIKDELKRLGVCPTCNRKYKG